MTYGSGKPRGVSLDQTPNKAGKKEFVPVAPGSYNSAAIILLTDGQRTTGVDTLEAAKLAADHGVRIYTVGVGTVDGETIGFEGWSMRVRLDEDSDTVQKAKRYHIYLFEQGRWLAEEGQEHGRLEGRLQALRQARARRDISRLGACYQDELARLTVLEEAVQAGVRRETERQAPLRKRRPTVLLAEEAARLDKKPRNPPRRVQ